MKTDQFLSQLNFNHNMSGIEASSYIKKLGTMIFGKDVSIQSIRFSDYFLDQNGRKIDCIAMFFKYENTEYYMLYGKPIGKLVFKSASEMYDYISKGNFIPY